MSVRMLPFRANGHETRIADGELTEVYEYAEYDLARYGIANMEPYFPDLGASRTCGLCGQFLALDLSEDVVTVRKPCPWPDGVTTVITLAVPSGKLLVTDNLAPVYYWTEDEAPAGYGSALGQAQAVEAMARAGCAYGPVGNTCPGLYRTGKDAYAIASVAYDHDEDRDLLPAGWEHLAGIITDLWAYSIADYEDWQARGGDPAALRLGWKHEVVDVEPGTYRFTCHTGERAFDRDAPGTVVFADIELVKEDKT